MLLLYGSTGILIDKFGTNGVVKVGDGAFLVKAWQSSRMEGF